MKPNQSTATDQTANASKSLSIDKFLNQIGAKDVTAEKENIHTITKLTKRNKKTFPQSVHNVFHRIKRLFFN